jgi:hypothetical protein
LESPFVPAHFDPGRLLQANNVGRTALKKAPVIGKPYISALTGEESDGKFFFEAGDGLTERTRRDPKAFRGAVKVFVLSDSEKIAKFVYFHYRNK